VVLGFAWAGLNIAKDPGGSDVSHRFP